MSEGVKLILTEIRSLKAAVEARLDAVDKKLGQVESRVNALEARAQPRETRPTEQAALEAQSQAKDRVWMRWMKSWLWLPVSILLTVVMSALVFRYNRRGCE